MRRERLIRPEAAAVGVYAEENNFRVDDCVCDARERGVRTRSRG